MAARGNRSESTDRWDLYPLRPGLTSYRASLPQLPGDWYYFRSVVPGYYLEPYTDPVEGQWYPGARFYFDPFNQDLTTDLNQNGVADSLQWLIDSAGMPPPVDGDIDDDGMPDIWEHRYSLDLRDAEDHAADPDNDKLSNGEEYICSTHPQIADSDGDGFPDGAETENGSDPTSRESTLEPAMEALAAHDGYSVLLTFLWAPPSGNITLQQRHDAKSVLRQYLALVESGAMAALNDSRYMAKSWAAALTAIGPAVAAHPLAVESVLAPIVTVEARSVSAAGFLRFATLTNITWLWDEPEWVEWETQSGPEWNPIHGGMAEITKNQGTPVSAATWGEAHEAVQDLLFPGDWFDFENLDPSVNSAAFSTIEGGGRIPDNPTDPPTEGEPPHYFFQTSTDTKTEYRSAGAMELRMVVDDPFNAATYERHFLVETQHQSPDGTQSVSHEHFTLRIEPLEDTSPSQIVSADFSGENGSIDRSISMVELYSDVNNDGQHDAFDSILAIKRPDPGEGAEYAFVNDNLSNGAWDRNDLVTLREGMPEDPDDDDAEALSLQLGATQGKIWFEHPAIGHMKFYDNGKCSGQELALKAGAPFDLRSQRLPTRIYLHIDTPLATHQVLGDLLLRFESTPNTHFDIARLHLTCVNDIEAVKHHKAVEDYILEKNAKHYMNWIDRSNPISVYVGYLERNCLMDGVDSRARPTRAIGYFAAFDSISDLVIPGNYARSHLPFLREFPLTQHGEIYNSGYWDSATFPPSSVVDKKGFWRMIGTSFEAHKNTFGHGAVPPLSTYGAIGGLVESLVDADPGTGAVGSVTRTDGTELIYLACVWNDTHLKRFKRSLENDAQSSFYGGFDGGNSTGIRIANPAGFLFWPTNIP